MPYNFSFTNAADEILNSGFMHMAAGLSVGLTGLAAGYAIGVVGDAVRPISTIRSKCSTQLGEGICNSADKA